jgi:hypothetical protein
LGTTETVEPYIQLNEQDIRKMEEITNIFKALLEKKILTINQFKDEISLFTKEDKHLIELSQVETIKTAYNNIVSIYLNPRNTQETRTHIKRILISFENYIINIINGLADIIVYMRANNSGHIDSVIRAYTLYEIILTQFEKGNFYKISDENIKHDLAINVKKHKPNLTRRTIPEHFSLDDGDDEFEDLPRHPDTPSEEDDHPYEEFPDMTQLASARFPRLGQAYGTFGTHQTHHTEESEPKADIRQHEHTEVYSDGKMSYEAKPSDITQDYRKDWVECVR